MVGRLRDNRVTVFGAATSNDWDSLLQPACTKAHIDCTTNGDGFGPSDQTSFYAADIPVLHFFTGAHGDYHKPSDTADKINGAGAAQIAEAVAELAVAVGQRSSRLPLVKLPAPLPQGDTRSFNASLGTIPDYAGPPNGQKGVLLAGVRPGGAAETAGLRRGDILVRLGKHEIGSVEDLMYVLNSSKPGERVTATLLREGKEMKVDVTFAESHRPR
jgi:hypothetical protein